MQLLIQSTHTHTNIDTQTHKYTHIHATTYTGTKIDIDPKKNVRLTSVTLIHIGTYTITDTKT